MYTAQEVLAALTIRERLFSVATRVTRATRAAAARMAGHIVAVRTDEVGHWDRVQCPADTTTFRDDGVGDAPVTRLKLHDVLARGELELVLGLREAFLGQLLRLWTDSVLVAPSMAIQSNPQLSDTMKRAREKQVAPRREKDAGLLERDVP